jgi:small multidrug resistance pump/quaternary ammonium compound-resistance protein SugE
MYAVWVLAAALCFTAGGVSMKASAGMTRAAPTVLFLVLFAVGAVLQARALRDAELGVAYLVVLGLEAVLAAVLGALVFAERLSPTRCLGVLTVVLGIVLLHLGGNGQPDAPSARTARSASAAPD